LAIYKKIKLAGFILELEARYTSAESAGKK